MKNFLHMVIFGLFLYSASASNNNRDLKTVQSGISDLGSGAHARRNRSLSAWCYGEWVVLVSRGGDVIIYNPRSYEESVGYYAPELQNKNIGLVNQEFYSIDTEEGVIRCTSIEQIIAPSIDKNGKLDIKWKNVGSFRAEKSYNLNHVAVQGDTMYFVTWNSNFYSFNTKSKKVDYLTSLYENIFYTSMLMFDNVLYMFRNNSFYTYDGHVLKLLKTPELKLPTKAPNVFVGIFRFRSTICTVGWDGMENKIPNYPVYCWNPKNANSKWEIFNYSYEARIKPAVATTSYGTFVFGGVRIPYGQSYDQTPWKDIKSVEMFDHNTLKWSYVPNTQSMKPGLYSAVTFNCE